MINLNILHIYYSTLFDKILNSLIDKGFLIRESGRGIRSKYFIILPLKNGGTPNNGGTPKNGSILPLKNGGIIPLKNGGRKENKKKIKENIYIKFVEEYIKLYPGSKIKSIRDKKLPGILDKYGVDEVKRCLERYADESKGKDKQYILNESTFWNGCYIAKYKTNRTITV